MAKDTKDMWSSNQKHEHDDYWKLRNYTRTPRLMKDLKSELERRGYNPPAKLTGSLAVDCLQRSDRGHMSYYGLSNDELREFVRRRKIPWRSGFNGETKATENRLIEMLEDADWHPSFEKFTDLPPELRNRVYEYYFADFTGPLYAPSQPPLSRTCRLLRQESLGMFYATSTFTFNFTSDRNGVSRIVGKQLHVPNRLALFVTNAPSTHFAAIQKFIIKIGANSWRGYIKNKQAALTIDIEIAAEGSQYKVTSNHQKDLVCYGPEVADRKANRVCKNIEAVIQEIVARQGKHRLRKDDVYKLRFAAERGLKFRS